MNAPVPPYRCWAEIDLGAMERNLKRIRNALPSALRYVAVVKADAYGHGLVPMTARLMHSGADLFAVANLDEAARIQEVGTGWPILLLSPVLPSEDQRLAEMGVTATISSAEELTRMAHLAPGPERSQPIHLKIDTGMGRLGVWHEEADDLLQAVLAEERVRLDGIYTHFSSAGDDPAYTRVQRERFLAVLTRHREHLPESLLIHADNSAGLESFTGAGPFNAVRVGMLQFGVAPYPRSLFGEVCVEPVLSLRARVSLVKSLPAGTPISYGQTYVLERPSRVAVLSAGYGDGVPSTLGNRGHVLVQGVACPIRGRVTMDQAIIDVTEVEQVAPGDVATLIGEDAGERVSVEDFSAWGDDLTWETFCSITQRVPRVYRSPLGT